jgi:hypothetical protein
MASGVQDGGQNQKSVRLKFAYIFAFCLYAMSYDFAQQHELLAKIAKNGGPIKNGGSKKDFFD